MNDVSPSLRQTLANAENAERLDLYERTRVRHEELLAKGRTRHPEWAKREDDAYDRCCRAIETCDVEAGARAMADWVDARALIIVYTEMEDERDQEAQRVRLAVR